MAGRITRGGWGWQHQKLRAKWAPAVATGMIRCALCGERIPTGAKWDLAHAPIRGAHQAGLYAGPSHAACNRDTSQAARQRKQRQRAPALAIFDSPPPKRNGHEVC